MLQRRIRVLVVDDEPLVIKALARLLRHAVDVDMADSARTALAALERQAYDAVLTDNDMPVESGLQLLERLQVDYPRIVRILISGRAPQNLQAQLDTGLVEHFFQKPVSRDAVLNVLKVAARIVVIGNK